MTQPKLLTWNATQVQIYELLKGGQSPAEIADQLKVSKASVTKVSNAMKKGQSPANPYIKPQPKQKKTIFPLPSIQSEKDVETPTGTDGNTATPGAGEGSVTPPHPKPALGNASILLLKPIPQTCALTPIMINARFTAITELHWPEDISWEDLIDTVFVLAFRYWGYGLQGVYKLDGNGNNGNDSPKPASEKPAGNGATDKDKAAALGFAIMDLIKGNIEALKAG